MPQPLEVWALHPYPFDIGVPPGVHDAASVPRNTYVPPGPVSTDEQTNK